MTFFLVSKRSYIIERDQNMIKYLCVSIEKSKFGLQGFPTFPHFPHLSITYNAPWIRFTISFRVSEIVNQLSIQNRVPKIERSG